MNSGQCVSDRICCTNCSVEPDRSQPYSTITANKGSDVRNWLLESTISSCKGKYESFRLNYGHILIDKVNISNENFEQNCLCRLDNDGFSEYYIKFCTFSNSNTSVKLGMLLKYNQFSVMFCKFEGNSINQSGLIHADGTKIHFSHNDFIRNAYEYLIFFYESEAVMIDCEFAENNLTANIDNITTIGAYSYPYQLSHISSFKCQAENVLSDDKIYVITCDPNSSSFLGNLFGHLMIFVFIYI